MAQHTLLYFLCGHVFWAQLIESVFSFSSHYLLLILQKVWLIARLDLEMYLKQECHKESLCEDRKINMPLAGEKCQGFPLFPRKTRTPGGNEPSSSRHFSLGKNNYLKCILFLKARDAKSLNNTLDIIQKKGWGEGLFSWGLWFPWPLGCDQAGKYTNISLLRLALSRNEEQSKKKKKSAKENLQLARLRHLHFLLSGAAVPAGNGKGKLLASLSLPAGFLPLQPARKTTRQIINN